MSAGSAFLRNFTHLISYGGTRGYNIGTRLIEDFLARSNAGRCADFKEVGEVVAKVWLAGDDYWLHLGRNLVIYSLCVS